MKRSQDPRRRAGSTSSPASTAASSAAATPSTVSVRTKTAEYQDGTATPRQKQRAAQRLASQQQPPPPQGKAALDSASTRTDMNTVSSNGVTTLSSIGTGVANPTSAHTPVSDEDHDSALEYRDAADECTKTLASSAQVAVPAKTVRRSSAARVVLQRSPSHDRARSPRHITIGATLATPPPAAPTSTPANPLRSSRGATQSTSATTAEGWTPRRNSTTVAQDVRRGSLPGPSPLSLTNLSPRNSARSQTTQASVPADVPRSVLATRRPRPGLSPLPPQQLLDEGYYLASDGSANSSFSDTPRSARPASLGSVSSRKAAAMQSVDLNAGGRVALLSASPTRGVVTMRSESRHVSGRGVCRSSSRASSSSGSSSDGGGAEFYEDEVDVHYDEEDEEQAVLTYMDSGADGSYNRARSGSGHLASSPTPLWRGNATTGDSLGGAVGDGDELDISVDLGTTGRDDGGADDPPSRLSVSTPPLVHRRNTSSARDNSARSVCNASITREPRPASPPRAKANCSGGSGGGASTPPRASPVVSAKAPPPPAAAASPLLRQQSSAAAPPPTRRSPPHRPANPSPMQPSPLSQFSLPPNVAPTSADEDARERQCRHLSLHEAFFFNQSRSFWLVDDHVLAKVLEYVRLMGYEHPALKRDRSKGQPSLWSSSSAISSPIAPGKPRKKAAAAAAPTAVAASTTKEWNGKALTNSQTSQSAAAAAVADAAAPDAATAAAAAAASASNNPYAFLGKQHHLRSGKPKCAGQYANTTSTSATHLFLTFNEALRWIVEQEYVIGTVLMCCARFIGDAEADGASVLGDGTADGVAWNSRRAMLQRGKPCIPVRLHPIHFVASLVMTHYPQWGGMTAFMRTWETQIRLVLGSAAPAHQRIFKCPDDGLLLSSDVDSGNLHRVERAPEPYFFLIWLEPDSGSDKRIWFRFSVTGAKEGRTLRFRLMNAAPHAKLYRQNGMMPVWRDGLSQVNWGPVDACSFRTTNHELDGEVCFSVLARNSTETIQIAFCAPYSYADLLCHVCHWHTLVKNSGCDMRFEERVLCRSPEGRKLHLLIVTSRTGGPPAANHDDTTDSGAAVHAGGVVTGGGSPSAPATSPTSVAASNKAKNGLGEVVHGPYATFSTGKKIVLVSGRVHPGEVTASHGVHGLISFLLSSDARAIQLREHFIFFIVPMLNPDGVSRGHSRLDQYGNNLNRCYNDPDPESQPTVLALRRVFEHLQRTYRERFIMYLDFHSHASQSSGFMFGNNLPVRVQHWNVFFPRLVELHARHVFSFGLCRFGRVHMTSKDGASRVLFGSSLIHSYTVELTHFTDRRLYADDFAAMNNGGGVLFKATWPPMHPPSGLAGGTAAIAAEDDAENGRGASRGANHASSTARGTPPSAGGRGGKRTTSSAAGHGKLSATGARPRAASVSAGVKAALGKGHSGGGPRKRGASVGVGERSARGRSKDSTSASASPNQLHRGGGPSLQPVAYPSVLCQSAEVGRACLLALLDYCSIGRHSDELNVFGGMSRVLRDVKRQMKVSAPSPSSPAKKAKRSQATATYAGLQPIYKQY